MDSTHKLNPEEHAKRIGEIEQLIENELSKSEYIGLNVLGNMLADDNYRWKDYKEELGIKTMYEWAELFFSDNYVVEIRDTGDWCLRKRTDSDAEKLYPYDSGSVNKEEIEQLNASLEITDKSHMCEVLRDSGNYRGSTDNKWIAYIAHCWGVAGLRSGGNSFTGPDPETGKMYRAIKLHELRHKVNKQQLYLLCEKENETDEKWVLNEHICGYPSSDSLGKIFRDILGISSENSSTADFKKLVQISENLTELYNNENLREALNTAANCLKNGEYYTCSDDSIFTDFKKLSDLWTSAIEYGKKFGINLSDESATLDDFTTAIKSNQDPAARKLWLKERLEALRDCESFEQFSSAIQPDITYLNSDGTEFKDLLEKYRALSKLATCEANDRWARASQIADKFKVDDFLAFAHVITTEGEHKEIIKNIGYYFENVSDLAPVNSAEDNLTNQHRDQSRRIPFSLIKSILSREIDTSQKNIVDQIEAEIGPLNKFEEMVVEGQELETLKKYDLSACYSSSDSINFIEERLEKIETLESGLTPLCAGNRLHQVQGNINQRAETYWLRAHYEKNKNADEKLLKLYGPAVGSHSDVDRPKELFIELFNNTECPAKNKPEYLHYILNLYSSDEQPQEVLKIFNEYPEVIYYSSNIDTIKNAARDQYDEEVLSYYKRVVESAPITDDLPDLENNDKILIYCDNEVKTKHITIDRPDFEYYKEILNYCKHVEDAHITIDLPDFENVVTKDDYNIEEFRKNLKQDPHPNDPDKERKDIPYDREKYRADIEHIYGLVHSYDQASTDFVLADDITRFMLLANDATLSETGRQCAKLLEAEYRWNSLDADDIALQAKYLFDILANDKTDRSIEIIRFYNAGAYHDKLKASHVCRKYYLEALCKYAAQTKKPADAEAAVDFACSHLRDVVRNNSYEMVKACCEIAERNNAVALLNTLKDIAEVPFYNSLLTLSGYKATDDELSALGFTKEEIERIAYVCSQPSLNGQPLEWITKQFHTTIGWRNGWTKKLLDHEFAIAQECGRVVSDNMLNLQAQYYSEHGDWSRLHDLLSKYENFRNDNPRIYAETLFRLKEHTEYWQNNELLSDYLTDEDGKVFHRIAAFKNDNLNSEENLNLTADYIATHADDILDLANWMWNEGKEEAWETLVPSWFASALTAYEKGYNLNQLKDLLSAGGAISEEEQRDYQAKWLASEHYAAAIFVWHYLGGDACEEAAIKFYNESNSRDEGMVLLFPEKSEAIKLRRAISILSSTRTNSNDNLIDAENANLISAQLRRDDIPPEQQRQLSTLLLKLEQVPTSLFTSIAVFWNKMITQDESALSDDMYRQMRQFLIQKCSKPIDITAATTLIKIYEKQNLTALTAITKNYCKNNGVLQLSLLNLVKNTNPLEIAQLFKDANAFVSPSDEDTRKVQDLQSGEQGIDIDEYAESILRVFCCTPLPIRIIEKLPLKESELQRLELFILSAQKQGNWKACVEHFLEIKDNVENPSEKLYSLFKQWLESNKNVDVSYILKCIMDAKDDLKQGWDIKEIFVLICQALCSRYPSTSAPNSDTLQRLSSFIDRYELESEFLSDEEIYNRVRQFYFQHLDALCYLLVKLARSGKIRNAGSWLECDLPLSSTYTKDPKYVKNKKQAKYTKELHEKFFLHMAQMDAVEFSSFISRPWVQKVLDFLSANGNLPSENALLKNWLWPEMCSGTAENVRASAEAINNLMDFFPESPELSRLLFFACKTLYGLKANDFYRIQKEPIRDLILWLYRAEYTIHQEALKYSNWNKAPHGQSNSTYLAQYEDFLQISVIAKHRGFITEEQFYANIGDPNEQMAGMKDKATPFYKQFFRDSKGNDRDFKDYYEKLNESMEAAKERDAKEGPDVRTNRDAIERIALCRITGSWKEGARYLFENQKKLHLREHGFREWVYTNLGLDNRCQTAGLGRGILQLRCEAGSTQATEIDEFFDDEDHPGQPIYFYVAEAENNPDLLNIPFEESTVDVALQDVALRSFVVESDEDYYAKLQSRTRLMIGIQYSETYWADLMVKTTFKTLPIDDLKAVDCYCQTLLNHVKKDKQYSIKLYQLACNCLLGKVKAKLEWHRILDAFLLVITHRNLDTLRFLNNINRKNSELSTMLRNLYNELVNSVKYNRDPEWEEYLGDLEDEKLRNKFLETLQKWYTNLTCDNRQKTKRIPFNKLEDMNADAIASILARLKESFEEYKKIRESDNSEDCQIRDKLLLNLINDYYDSQNSSETELYQDTGEIIRSDLPKMLTSDYIQDLKSLAEIWKPHEDALNALTEEMDAAQLPDSSMDVDDSTEADISEYSYICSAVFNYTADISALQKILDEVKARNSTSIIWSNFKRLLEKDLDRLTAGPKFEISLSDDRAIKTKNAQDEEEYAIFGIVKNTGNRSATNASLKVEFMTEGVRATYTVYTRKLLELWPGATAPFRINFETVGTIDQVDFKLTAEGDYGGFTRTSDEKDSNNVFSLKLAESAATGDIPQSFTEPICTNHNEYIKKGKDVTHENWVGRSNERKVLRSWYVDNDFAEKKFADWENGLIYGFLRSGKSTLLTYVEALIEIGLDIEDVKTLHIPLSEHKTDRQSIKDIFVKILMKVTELENDTEFYDYWINKEISDEMASYQVSKFLQALSDRLGKKLLLLFDEFDCFFAPPHDYKDDHKKVREFKEKRCNFLNAICYTDQALREKVHFVFCGSNNMVDPTLDTQFFQRGVKMLHVGKASYIDMLMYLKNIMMKKQVQPPEQVQTQEQVQKFLEHDSVLPFAKSTLSLLYQASGGFLWNSYSMLGKIASKCSSETRRKVYPYDVLSLDVIRGPISTGSHGDMIAKFKGSTKELLINELANSNAKYMSKKDLATMVKGVEFEVSEDLKYLADLGFLEGTEDQINYRIANEIFRNYLRKVGTEYTCVFTSKAEKASTPTNTEEEEIDYDAQ